ncbi:benzoate/H(+) symporter BenE family transporter [Alkalihalobacillus sp. MEB130]|uniref:benzoate/H(+) symporter BenE family transporter n=1 Tax=Alkalihalobacillus sp. MEB130 TaxID=2976704 RepID=UPI0028E08959|nr:benzoate/H(+) symporter BenE family transporter [Alkalihalobacillus sp. MEB130]MDT8862612.1 benzoate/H(+) symporter BenE family transporter [Alkalihalobacillus sp. MEB130]
MDIFRRLLGQRGDTNPLKDLNYKNVSAGLVASLLVMTGPAVLLLQAADNGNFTMTQTILWVFSIYVMGGVYSILLPLYYRIPIVGGHTITGLAFLATVTSQFTYYELLGAYLFSGLLIFVVGYFRLFGKLIHYVPREVLSAMLAGMILKYMVDFIGSVEQLAGIGGVSLLVYLMVSKWLKQIPPMLAAITTAFIMLFFTQTLTIDSVQTAFVFPIVQLPAFNLLSFLSVSIPLALLILSNDAAVGIGALEQNKFRPQVNRIISSSGIFSMITSFFGGQSANVAGMMTAICADKEAGPREKRYMGAVVSGVITILFGVFSYKLVPLISSLPEAFVSILIGFALIGVFANSLYLSFSNPTMKLGAAFSFIIAVSNITVFHVGAPVWALLIGTFITRFIEKDTRKDSKETKAA